jgi:hypothetical protein
VDGVVWGDETMVMEIISIAISCESLQTDSISTCSENDLRKIMSVRSGN